MRARSRRELLARAAPFAALAIAGQASVAWPPGPPKMGLFWLSCGLLILAGSLPLLSRGAYRRRLVAAAVVYVVSATFLLLATGGVSSGLGTLLLIPIVAIAIYGRRRDSAFVIVAVLLALLIVSLLDPHVDSVTARRLVLFGAVGAIISLSIHVLRDRLGQSIKSTVRLLHEADVMNMAARQLTSLLDPSAITTLGVELAARLATPPESHARWALYFRIENDYAVIDAQFDDSESLVEKRWPMGECPSLRRAAETMQPVVGPIESPEAGPTLRSALTTTGVTHGAWVPVCPDGVLHGVLAIASRGVPVPEECLERCVALGHLLELALSNWWAHERLEQQATAEERRRIARELHDGLAHELAFIASKTKRSKQRGDEALDLASLAGAADRALDEARRAITVLSSSHPQSLAQAVAQTAEDLGSRFGVPVKIDISDQIDTPGEITEHLLRIVREAMVNAANHGSPTSITVQLCNADGVRLRVEDDGCGFDSSVLVPATGFGLLSMKERAESIGASLRVDSTPSRGTRVEVVLR